MNKKTKRTAKRTARRAVTAILCLSVALTGGAAMGLAGYRATQGGGYTYTASAEGETANAYGGLDLTAGIKNKTGETIGVDGAQNTLIFTFPAENMEAGSKMEENALGEGKWTDYVTLHSTVEEPNATYTLTEWIAKGKSFRFAVYGKCFILQFENNSFGGGAEIDRVGFKAGFKLFQGGTANEDWVFHKKCDVSVDSTTFTKDLTLYVNRTTGKYEYYAQSLALTGTPGKTVYTAGEQFDPTGLSLAVTTPSNEVVEVPVTAEMCPAEALTAETTSVTITYGGGTVTQAVTVEAPAKTVQSVAIEEGGALTAKRFSLPSELTIADGTKVTVTYSDGSSEEKDFALTMLKGAFDANNNPVAGSVDTSTAGEKEVPFVYSDGVSSAESTIKLTVSEELKPTKIAGVHYGAAAEFSGGFTITFDYIDGADQNLKSLDKIKDMPSLIPGTKLKALVELKFSKKADTVKLGNSNLSSWQPAFYGGQFCMRGSGNVPAKFGELEYVIIRAGFIWYGNKVDTWPQEDKADTSGYYPIASNYVAQDLYIGHDGGKLVKPITTLSVNVPEGKTLTFAPGQALTDADLADVTYTAEYLDPAETTPLTGNVTAAMCSKVPTETGAQNVTVTLLGKTATFPVTVEAPAKKVTGVTADFALTAKKFALPSQIAVPAGAKLTVTYSDGSTEQKDFTLDMLGVAGNAAGVIDTSKAGDLQLDFTYSEGGVDVTGKVTLTVGETAQTSSLTGISYGGDGEFSGHRKLPFNAPDGKIVYGQKGQASLVPGKKLGDLVFVKFANEENEIACTSLTKDGTVNAFGSTWFLQIADEDIKAHGAVEYVHFLPGVLLYNATVDNDTSTYYPRVDGNGNYAYFAQDAYIAWTAQTAAEKYGKVIKPFRNLTINVPADKTLKFAPGQTLTDADLEGVTFSADYLDPAETEKYTGAVTAAMCSRVPETVGEGQITVTLYGQTATFNVTVEAPAKTVTEVTANFTLTARRYSLPSEIAVPEGAKLTVKYSDNSSEEKDFAIAMIAGAFETNGNEKAGVIDTTKAGDVNLTFVYTEGGVEYTGTVKLTVSNEAKASNITGVMYGTDWAFSGGFGADLAYVAQGSDGLNSIDGFRNLASLIPGKTLGDLVLIKFAKQAEPIPLNNEGISALTPAFFGGKFCIRDTGNISSETYGSIEYVIIKEGFIWYNAPANHWGGPTGGNNADPVANGYYPVGTNYVTKDLYIGVGGSKLVKPVTNFSLTVKDGKTLEFFPEYQLTAEDLEGVTYSAEWLDPNETEAAPSGNVTPAMCSATPSAAGAGTVTVTLNNATATFDVNVLDVSMPVSIEVVAVDDTQPFSITYKRYAVEPEFINCQLKITYEDGTFDYIDLKPEYITKRPNTRKEYTDENDKPVDIADVMITLTITRYGKTVVNEEIPAKIEQKNIVASNIDSVAYGKDSKSDAGLKNYYVVYFNWKNGGDQGLKALDAIHKMPSSAPGKKNGDFIKIKFSNQEKEIPLSDKALSALQPAVYGGAFVLREVDKLDKTVYGEIEYIVFEKGVVWYIADKDTFGQGNGANTSGYRPIPTNIFTKKMYATWDKEGRLEKPIKTLEAVTVEGYKTEYFAGEELSLDFTLNVTYMDGTSEVITPTRDMCGEIADGKAAITYKTKSCEIAGLTYDATKKVGGIAIEKNGKTKYSFGVEEFDISDYVVKVILLDVENNTEVERRVIKGTDIEISGFDSHTIGTHHVQFLYAGQKADVDVEVVNDAPEKHMTIDYISNYDSYERTQLMGISIHFGFTAEVGKVQTKAFLYAGELPNVADKIMVNGKLVSEWMKTGEIEHIGFFAEELYLRFPTNRLQPTTNPVVDSNKTYGWYEEGVTELVETVTILPGFQYYQTKKDFWGDKNWTMADVTPIKHGVVKEEITLVNVMEGGGWVRQFKQNADKTGLANDAITVSKLPAKTTFKVGDEVGVSDLLDGLELLLKYEDGGSETYIPSMTDVEFDENLTATEGKKTVTVYFKYNDYHTSFEIEVQKAAKKKRGCKSEIVAPVAMVGGMIALGSAVAVTVIAKKRKNDGDGEETK